MLIPAAWARSPTLSPCGTLAWASSIASRKCAASSDAPSPRPASTETATTTSPCSVDRATTFVVRYQRLWPCSSAITSSWFRTDR